MNRTLFERLVAWKELRRRKPLVLKGARQVGKTTLLKSFGEQEFKKTHYFNFEKQKKIHAAFDDELSPEIIVERLSVLSGLSEPIDLNSDLIIFDEIQECARALTSLKYFCEEAPKSFIASAGSLLGVKVNEASFPVGKVQFEMLYPMSFYEFISALSQKPLESALKKALQTRKIDRAFHDVLLPFFSDYLVVGGMPEVVSMYLSSPKKSTALFKKCRELQGALIESYLNDISKHSGKINSMHIERVWKSVPMQLARQNDRYFFKDVIPGKKGFEAFAKPIDWLENAGLLLKCNFVNQAQMPLSAYQKENQFKLYLFDVGILGALADFSIESLRDMSDLDLIYKGFFYENFVAQELHQSKKNLNFWSSNISEVDFLVQSEKAIIPIEVKSKLNRKAKSLKVFQEMYSTSLGYIATPEYPLQKNQIPIYLVSGV